MRFLSKIRGIWAHLSPMTPIAWSMALLISKSVTLMPVYNLICKKVGPTLGSTQMWNCLPCFLHLPIHMCFYSWLPNHYGRVTLNWILCCNICVAQSHYFYIGTKWVAVTAPRSQMEWERLYLDIFGLHHPIRTYEHTWPHSCFIERLLSKELSPWLTAL